MKLVAAQWVALTLSGSSDPHRNNQVNAWLLKMTGHHYEFVTQPRAIPLAPLVEAGAAKNGIAEKSTV